MLHGHSFDCECVELTQIVRQRVYLTLFCLKKNQIIFLKIYVKYGILPKTAAKFYISL